MLQRGFKSLFLTLLAFAGTGLFAQLDSRLQQGKTDFMDLYQSSGAKKAKPEIVTVLDFSGSMQRLMFHPGFPNNADDEDTTSTRSDYRNLQVILSGSAPNINATVTWTSGTTAVTSIKVPPPPRPGAPPVAAGFRRPPPTPPPARRSAASSGRAARPRC